MLHFQGFVRDVRYSVCLSHELPVYQAEVFNINEASSSGLLICPNGQTGFSRWVSPKRTRSYPFERLYNTYNCPHRITIIPVIKDEGADGDLDRVQYSTFSWMNLLNIYVVLAYYSSADKNTSPNRRDKHCLTYQKLDSAFVNAQIEEIQRYKQSALHWNRTLFETRFVSTYQYALEAYQNISKQTKVNVHSLSRQESYVKNVIAEYDQFRDISLRGSLGASKRESGVSHQMEYLSEGIKATLEVQNYLGGVYHLTVDEVIQEGDVYTLQESKNATKSLLPSLSDIKDGLFKLILYSNLDTLHHNGEQVAFRTRLKLTGRGVQGTLKMPCTEQDVTEFAERHGRRMKPNLLKALNEEAKTNGLQIVIGGNQ